MAAVPLPPSPPGNMRTPELTLGEISKLITQYVAQIKYYENPKLWKTYLRNELWKFAKSKNHNYTQNDLQDHAFKNIGNNILELVDKDNKWQPTEIATEITKFTQYYTIVLFDYEFYFGRIENVPETPNINLKEIDPILGSELGGSFVALVTWEEFIAMWYRDIDRTKIVPLYLLHQKRFYDWFGNKSLQATVDMIADKPREKWRYILKKMCKIGVVDHEYIRHTCDMRWITEECLMDETERYTRRY